MGAAQELGTAIGQVVADVGGSVVGIGPGWGLGSGVVLADHRVLTNAHNVPADEVAVRFADGARATGRVVARDVDGDLAVVALDTGGAPPISWGDASEVGIGTPVVALANPGGRGPRATLGFISATDRTFRGPRGRRVRGALEHTAPMARGSSGGPLVGLDGRLLGVNTHRLGEGFYLARPAGPALRERIEALARGEAPRRRRLGVALAPDGAAPRLRAAVGLPEQDGVLVHAVEDGGPADRAGIRRGDLLIAAGARELARIDDLIEALDTAGEQLALTLMRGTDSVEVTVPLAEAPG